MRSNLTNPERAIICGDLHGKIWVYENLRQRAEKLDAKMILLGDFSDSFDMSDEDHVILLDMVIEDANADKARFVLGNHELSYIYPSVHRCSGFRKPYERHILERQDKLIGFAEAGIYLEPDIIVTHSGITRQHWNALFSESTNDTLWDDMRRAMIYSKEWHHIGRYRGGRNPFGGPQWCDWNDEFVPVTGVRQVVGHTACFAERTALGRPRNFTETIVGNLRTNENGDWNVDCLDRGLDFLYYEKGALKQLEL